MYFDVVFFVVVVVFLPKTKIKKQPQPGVTLMGPECSKQMPSELACGEWYDHLPSN